MSGVGCRQRRHPREKLGSALAQRSRLAHIWQTGSGGAAALKEQFEDFVLAKQISDLPNREHRDERNEHHKDSRHDVRSILGGKVPNDSSKGFPRE